MDQVTIKGNTMALDPGHLILLLLVQVNKPEQRIPGNFEKAFLFVQKRTVQKRKHRVCIFGYQIQDNAKPKMFFDHCLLSPAVFIADCSDQ
jgi:hypothetical protein